MWESVCANAQAATRFENKEVWADLQLLAAMDQTLDVLMFQYSIEDVDMVAKRLPNLKILMNHVAGADIEGKPADPKWVAARFKKWQKTRTCTVRFPACSNSPTGSLLRRTSHFTSRNWTCSGRPLVKTA